jgi:hypothetical protein
LNHPLLLKSTDAPGDGGGGQRDALGKLDLAQPPVLKQRSEDRAIERVQLDFSHFTARFAEIEQIFCAIIILRRRKSQQSSCNLWQR